jgi:phage repressor protein C with HTH and peptisase S24 domain
MATMLTHPQVWGAIDRLAARHGFSASGLAKKAGLDPTSFNRSKRVTPEGRPRWPSTESIAKVLQATGATIDDFITLLSPKKGRRLLKSLPMVSLAKAGGNGLFNERGYPAGPGWDVVPFPSISDEHAYALEISTHALEPLYRKGDIVIISPAASCRRGDRIAVRLRSGDVFIAEFKRKSPKSVDIVMLTPGHRDRSIPASEIAALGRVVWASQ